MYRMPHEGRVFTVALVKKGVDVNHFDYNALQLHS